MKFSLLKRACTLLLSLTLFSGCYAEDTKKKDLVKYEVNPETFAISVINKDKYVPVSNPIKHRKVEDFSQNGAETKWTYPEDDVEVSVKSQAGYVEVNITSNTDADNEFEWPKISGETYFLPFGEGKRVPSKDSVWANYLSGQEFEVIEQLSMPFWASVQNDYSVMFILENSFRNTLKFDNKDEISFSLNHSYPQIDKNKQNKFRIYVTENNPTSVAKIYRDYVIEKGDFVTLEEKAKKNPNIKKLYGAPHIYLAGELLISPEDINWKEFRIALKQQDFRSILLSDLNVENNAEIENIINEISTQDYVSQYQKNSICKYLSEVFKTEDKNEIVKKFPKVFSPVKSWIDNETVGLIKDLKKSGIDKAWIGLHSWKQAFAKPELTKTAIDSGYLAATYDSYHSIHKNGEAKWITADFKDTSLYENATVTNKNGEKVSGFKGVGRKLNPTLSLPSVKERMESILSPEIKFNSWFIDCDATGEIYDDYSKEHITTQQQDLAARLDRMNYIKDKYNMVIGSEGGNDFAASSIAFAHGIELRTFSWMDEDMSKNKDSKYYMGKYYSATGGVPEHFAKRVPIKEDLYKIFVDTKYDIPLYKLVYNDSVITTYHWDWSTFKIIGAEKNRMLREVLYNVPPLYHLDKEQWQLYKEDIVKHNEFWSKFSKDVITKEMTDFKNLSEDGSVQMCKYGDDIFVVANFGETKYNYEGQDIMPQTLLLKNKGKVTTYTPQFS